MRASRPLAIAVQNDRDNSRDEPDLNRASCDYFRGKGTCSFGCREEPSCQTDMPLAGWPRPDLRRRPRRERIRVYGTLPGAPVRPGYWKARA